jgi:hypothetical protein
MGNGGGKGNGDGNGDGKNPPGTYLVIPYFSGDMGSRPLPSADPFWMCTSILINGSPYAGQQLIVGETIQLSLDAINYGTLTAPAVCMFFWANPTTAFTNATVQFIGQTSLSLARNALTLAGPVSWTVPAGIPQHVCLLAEITSPADAAPNDYDAATDRHYGQQNVQVMTAAPGGQIRVGFHMANGRAAACQFRLEVTHVAANHRALRHLVAGHAVARRAEHIELRRSGSKAAGSQAGLNTELAIGEVLDVELNARVPSDAVPGSVIVLQLAQYEQHRHQPVGGLGVVVNVR